MFSVDQIIAAINDPTYKNGTPGQPVGFPCVAQADVVAGVVCPYLYVQPSSKVILEILGYTANVPQGGTGQNFIFMMTTLAALIKASLAAPLAGTLTLLQSANPQGKAKSRLLSGEINGGVPPTPAQYVNRGFFSAPNGATPIHRLPSSIVVIGGAAQAQVCGLMGSGPDLTFYPSIYCREWPFDLTDYTP